MSEENQQTVAANNVENKASQTEDTKWQRDAIERLASAALTEQRTARRWGTFFKGLTFTYLLIILLMALGVFSEAKKKFEAHTALIDISGVIQAGGDVNAEAVMSSLHDAYDNKGTKGIIFRINSPGGSPVQAGIIFDEIKRQKKLHPNIPVYAVVEDICASGGYYIAA
ncbi:MAG: S49 family peptidase, partial [Methylotenera sp.]|nr:S49 family peptidase [Methylotenera sp.]